MDSLVGDAESTVAALGVRGGVGAGCHRGGHLGLELGLPQLDCSFLVTKTQ